MPAVVISPLIERNVLDGTTYDHTSLLATVEAIFGLKPLTARDAAANTLLKLLTRISPRSDAPTDIGEAADSGFSCEDDSERRRVDSAGGQSSDAALGAAKRAARDGGRNRLDWVGDREAVGSTMRGFQEIALLKALKNAKGRDRPLIRKEFFAANSKGGAKFFIHKVALMTQQNRVSALRQRRLGNLSLLLPTPKRRWFADPIYLYRRRARQ